MRPALHVVAWNGPGRLATVAHPRGGDALKDEMVALAEAGVDVLVSALTPDEQHRLGLTELADAATAAGLEFVAVPIADRGVPAGDQSAIAGRLAEDVRSGRFVVTQCFAGVGRSTLLAALVLTELGVGAERALELVGQARGLPVPDNQLQRDWIMSR